MLVFPWKSKCPECLSVLSVLAIFQMGYGLWHGISPHPWTVVTSRKKGILPHLQSCLHLWVQQKKEDLELLE